LELPQVQRELKDRGWKASDFGSHSFRKGIIFVYHCVYVTMIVLLLKFNFNIIMIIVCVWCVVFIHVCQLHYGFCIHTSYVLVGSATYVSSGSCACPSFAAITLRCGWAMGGVYNRYLKYQVCLCSCLIINSIIKMVCVVVCVLCVCVCVCVCVMTLY